MALTPPIGCWVNDWMLKLKKWVRDGVSAWVHVLVTLRVSVDECIRERERVESVCVGGRERE